MIIEKSPAEKRKIESPSQVRKARLAGPNFTTVGFYLMVNRPNP